MLSASILISIFEFRTWITKVHTYLFVRIDENLKHKNWTYWQSQKKCIHSLVNIWILFSNWESFLWENAKNSVQSQTAVFNKVFPARAFYYYTQSTSIHTTAMMSGIPQLSSHKLQLSLLVEPACTHTLMNGIEGEKDNWKNPIDTW